MAVEDYVGALFDQKIPRVSYSQLSLDRRVGSAITRRVTKTALNPIYYKGNVLDNLVEVKPLKNQDGSFV